MADLYDLSVGDAVVPKNDPGSDVMTVYDLIDGYTVALCNWVIGTSMFKARIPVRDLIKVARTPRAA